MEIGWLLLKLVLSAPIALLYWLIKRDIEESLRAKARDRKAN